MTLADLSHLEVETDWDEAFVTQIRLGQHAVLQLAGKTTLRDSRFSSVSQRVDKRSECWQESWRLMRLLLRLLV
ncbi:hypothetical protein C8N30_3385 [Sulfitobacter guttiformis]|uniref:Uncharacterized protein n=2 Tax=Sulfitobacter guttiformis TaxID=74349 RepID=A0A420DJ85_9RHOB|nr:hypothetical protein C8N30_3385 [Sulfitobacter guttiformis]